MNILFSANDAGGANSIAPVVAALAREGANLRGVVSGPAAAIFAASGIPFTAFEDDPVDVFIAGTSAGDTPDKQIMQRIGSTPSISVLDFWSNYWQRFSTPGEKDFIYLPTKVCVMDDIAKDEMLAEGFPAERLVVTGNPHFDHFADALTRENEEAERIIFISQPLAELSVQPGYSPVAADEYAVLADLLEAIEALPGRYYLSLRLHPKEPADKYEEYIGERARRASEPTLEESLSNSGLIVGISSPVLMQAAAAGKKVLSYEPKLTGKDPLVSNRAGVTTRIENKEQLVKAFVAYAQGKWPFTTKTMRDIWSAGATERVVKEVHKLVDRK